MRPEEVFPAKWLRKLEHVLENEYTFGSVESEDLPNIEENSPLGFFFGLCKNRAVTIGKVFLTPRFWDAYLQMEESNGAWYAKREYFSMYAHEAYHALDQKQQGLCYYPRYILRFLKFGGRRNHPMERGGYKLHDKMWNCLQTEISREKCQ